MVMHGLVITLALQIISATVNSVENRKKNQRITELRRKDKEERQKNSQRMEYERFQRASALQMKLEDEAHIERLKDIETDFKNRFILNAHEQALHASPLRISPYVIRNTIMPLFDDIRKEEVFCILTNSNDADFNNIIIPLLDQLLCDAISNLWNKSSLHTICYYTNVWKSNRVYADEEINNMMALFKTPTVTITPYIINKEDKNNEVSIRINIWTKDYKINYTLDTAVTFDRPVKQLTKEGRNEIVSSIFSQVLCAMGYQIDLYYWTAYNQSPLLPRLMSTGAIQCDDITRNTYKEAYIELYKIGVLGKIGALTELSPEYVEEMRDNVTNTLYFTPDKGISCLQSISSITSEKEELCTLLSDTLLSIYKARFEEVSVKSLEEIDSNKLTDVDVDIVLELIQLAKKRNCSEVVQKFNNIIRRVIENNHTYQSCQ